MSDSWIGSLDVETYVKQLMNREGDNISKVSQIKIDQLMLKQSGFKAQVSAYGQLQSLLSTLQQNISKLNKSFDPISEITSSDSNIATVKVDGVVSPGSHTLVINNLAQAERIASQAVSTTGVLNKTDTIHLSVGQNNVDVNVEVDDTLQNIADKINANAMENNVGILASVVTTGADQYKLIVSSLQTGIANQVEITESGTDANALGLSTETDGQGAVLTAATNAVFTLDNIVYELPSNSNLIDGMNITILNVGTVIFSATQTNQISKVKEAMDDTINTYNQAMTFIEKNKVTSGLPDATLSLIQSNLKSSMVNSPILNELGILPMDWKEIPPISINLSNGSIATVHPTGLLKINTDPLKGPTLESQITQDFSDVKSALINAESPFTKIKSMLETSTGSIWKLFNDTQKGALPLANMQVNKLQSQIDATKSNTTKLKEGLVRKYAKLDLMLANLQVSSHYMAAQLEAFNHK
jgi:flagellar hook-associated protein 2